MTWVERVSMLSGSNDDLLASGSCACSVDIYRWMFMGMSVRGFNCQLGWGTQPTTLTVELFPDTESCTPMETKRYVDESLCVSTTSAPDPGFTGQDVEVIGAPVVFRYEDFEFAGIVQGWSNSNSRNGYNLYTVRVTSPHEILRGTSVILTQHDGLTRNIPNVINVFGALEEDENTQCLNFGRSGYDGDGIAWTNVKQAIHSLASYNLLTTDYCDLPDQQGAPQGDFEDYIKNRGLFHQDFVQVPDGHGYVYSEPITSPIDQNLNCYFLDLTDIPDMPVDYRIEGPQINLLDLIDQVCQDAGLDYFIEYLPTPVDYQGSLRIISVIKVRTVNRRTSKNLDKVQEFVSDLCVSGCGVIEYNYGREFVEDPVNVMVLGAQRNGFAVVEDQEPLATGCVDAGAKIIPYFGKDQNGNIITGYYDEDGNYEFYANAAAFEQPNYFDIIDFPTSYNGQILINELELQIALAGFDAWSSHIGMAETDTWNILLSDPTISGILISGIYDYSSVQQVIADNSGNLIMPSDHVNTNKDSSLNTITKEISDKIEHDEQRVYDFVANLARDYYGKRYAVRLDNVCATEVKNGHELDQSVCAETSKINILTNYEVASSAWNIDINETGCEETGLLGLDFDTRTSQGEFFRIQDGSVTAFVKYENATGLDYDSISQESYGYTLDEQSGLFVKVSVEPDFVWCDAFNTNSFNTIQPQTAWAVVELPQAITPKYEDGFIQDFGCLALLELQIAKKFGIGSIASLDDAINSIKERMDKAGFSTVSCQAFPKPVKPKFAAIPLESKYETFGPWVNSNQINGKTEVRQDTTLQPRNFGSCAEMENIGQAIADLYSSESFVVEQGQVIFPGYPTSRLGAELLGVSNITGEASGNQVSCTRQLAQCSESKWEFDCTTNGYYYKVKMADQDGPLSGTNGPNITSISTSIGTDGVITTYGIRSFTKKFNTVEKRNIDQLRALSRAKQEFRQELREIKRRLLNGRS